MSESNQSQNDTAAADKAAADAKIAADATAAAEATAALAKVAADRAAADKSAADAKAAADEKTASEKLAADALAVRVNERKTGLFEQIDALVPGRLSPGAAELLKISLDAETLGAMVTPTGAGVRMVALVENVLKALRENAPAPATLPTGGVLPDALKRSGYSPMGAYYEQRFGTKT